MPDRKLKLTDPDSGKSLDLPVISGSQGDPTLDISSLYSELGYFTFDPSYGTTASCKSDITFIDGEAGILRYRGYPIEQLAENSSFLEVAYRSAVRRSADAGSVFELRARHHLSHDGA